MERCSLAVTSSALRQLGALIVLLLLLGAPSARASASTTFDRNGINANIPSGWWASDRSMSNKAVEPLFRLTVSNRPLTRTTKNNGPCYAGIGEQIQPRAVVAILREAVGADFKPTRFGKRPARFVLPKRRPGQDNSCLGDHATLISFKDSGRGFYLWIAAGRGRSTRESPTPPNDVGRPQDPLTRRTLSAMCNGDVP